jgi:hypothetical protein
MVRRAPRSRSRFFARFDKLVGELGQYLKVA